MNIQNKKSYAMLKKNLHITRIISIRFSDAKTNNFKKYRDTACTAIIRCLTINTPTYIDRQKGQLCPGGNFFLAISPVTKKELHDTYITNEKVFESKPACNDFLNKIPRYPQSANKRYILFSPLAQEREKPDVIMLLANPAQAGRILGLSVYKKMSQPSVVPALSTCASIYAPLASNSIHLNFIDYYDRYYQGVQHGRNLWKDSQCIISMPYTKFADILRSIPLSAHGSYRPTIIPQKIDRI